MANAMHLLPNLIVIVVRRYQRIVGIEYIEDDAAASRWMDGSGWGWSRMFSSHDWIHKIEIENPNAHAEHHQQRQSRPCLSANLAPGRPFWVANT
jgi:hypothetical protein